MMMNWSEDALVMETALTNWPGTSKSSWTRHADATDTELHFHLTTTLPEKIAFQLKLLPKVFYTLMIAKAQELRLIFQRAAEQQVSQVDSGCPRDQHLERLEEALFQVSAQLAAIDTRPESVASGQCFKCRQPGHLTRNCRSAFA